jgi:hypothetical protein
VLEYFSSGALDARRQAGQKLPWIKGAAGDDVDNL